MCTLKRTKFVENRFRFFREKKYNMKAAKRLSPSRILIQTAVPLVINYTLFCYRGYRREQVLVHYYYGIS
jgi:hypothetical protein